VKAIGKDGGDGYDFAGHGHALHQGCAVHYGGGPADPGYGEKVVWHEATEDEDREVFDIRVREDEGKNEGQNPHHHERVQYGPKNAQGHVSVPDPEVLQYEVFKEKN
jgi:hypothetical protein